MVSFICLSSVAFCFHLDVLLDHANQTFWVGRHFNGEESFDTGPMAPASDQPAVANSSILETSRSGGTKL
jgi:hypothetical protein